MLQGILKKIGLQKIPNQHPGPQEFEDAYIRCKPNTMTSRERMAALWSAMDWLNSNHIKGAFLECGVWKGGSSMLAAENCRLHPQLRRNFYLYDTFEGMSQPDEIDKDFRGQTAETLMQNALSKKKTSNIWAVGSVEVVRNNMLESGLAPEQTQLIKGMVEDTIQPDSGPQKIALLRLDTDWYQSTKHELNQLFHRIVPGGFLIIDDYGHWNGCKQAVDEFFSDHSPSPFFHRIDYTGIIMQRQMNPDAGSSFLRATAPSAQPTAS
jgi:O-methyltransferase